MFVNRCIFYIKLKKKTSARASDSNIETWAIRKEKVYWIKCQNCNYSQEGFIFQLITQVDFILAES